jgi:4a-hydroxytetrahydrobiopterin dehydratase
MNLGEVGVRLGELKGWALEGNGIIRDFDFPNFSEALDFVNKLKEVCEKQEHFPIITIDFNRVQLGLKTHDIIGLSEKDFELAKEIDKISS